MCVVRSGVIEMVLWILRVWPFNHYCQHVGCCWPDSDSDRRKPWCVGNKRAVVAPWQLNTCYMRMARPLLFCLLLQALSVVQQSAALQEDSHSQAVASATLAALVPAWLASGKGSEELWTSLIDVLPELSAPRRLPLLATLLTALPEVSRRQ
jgi:hypothetical protein